MSLSPANLTFCIISFEGPDRYATAGGLGVRVNHLARTLAGCGFDTHFLFVGEPSAPGLETQMDGRLTLHRWCQWISAHHSGGVYDGEEAKLWDFNESAPPFILENIIRPVLAAGSLPVVLAEEWHTAEALIRLHNQLQHVGMRERCLLFWNANNTMSFHRVDWPRLDHVAQLTTVSRYMKHLMWGMGLNPLVIPNGIPTSLLEPVKPRSVAAVRSALGADEDDIMLFKVGRFDPAKRWLMAIEAAAQLKQAGWRVVFPLRGGIEPYGATILARARELGLVVSDVAGAPSSEEELLALLQAAPTANIYNLRFYMSQEWLRLFYAGADAVLANSGHEPFGLVGLEAMAAGGVVFTGITGEEYTLQGKGAVVLDTDSPVEIVSQLMALRDDPQCIQSTREAARAQAAAFTWDRVSQVLLDKVRFVAEARSVIPGSCGLPVTAQRRVEDVLIYTVVHQPRRLRLPAAPLPSSASPEQLARKLFDEPLNEKYFRKVASTCYYPATEGLQAMVEAGFKFAIGFSLSFLEQAQRWDPELLLRFVKLVRNENVELVAVEPTHSFLLLWDLPGFIERMRYAAGRLQEIFGQRPVVADTTEMMMSDPIYHALDQAGFDAAFMDGRPWILDWRQPTYLYRHGGGQMKLFTRHYRLSDDVGYRFSNRGWSGWPLMADRYASWLAESPGDLVVLGWDFETFGEHHRYESGIFGFLEALPMEVHKRDLSFVTPSEALERHGGHNCELPLPAFASTWAGSGGLEFFLGNDAQKAVFHLMIQAYNKALLTGKEDLVDLARWLAQSDNLHLIQWHGRSGSEAEVSAYFTPHEWWSLGADGIVWEIQQVYKNFIAALDTHLPRWKNVDLKEGRTPQKAQPVLTSV